MTDELVEYVVWDEAGFGMDGYACFVHDFGWRLHLGTVDDLGVPEEFYS